PRLLSPGPHTVRFTQTTPGSTAFDALLIDPNYPYDSIIDDADSITYTGTWVFPAAIGPIDNTSHFSKTIGNTVSFDFTGTQIKLLYSNDVNRGSMQVQIDDLPPETFSQYGPPVWQLNWTSDILSAGTHTITLTHLTGFSISLDAFIVDPNGAATVYDDSNQLITYTGPNWVAPGKIGPLYNTSHFSTAINSTAVTEFTGYSFTLLYSSDYNRGSMQIQIDNYPPYTLNQYGPPSWQLEWQSPRLLSPGPHTVRFTQTTPGSTAFDALLVLP
ncbi:MAG: hypothetical protein ACYC6C_14725, partial [Coriobacteriia bacterium]